MDWQSALTRIVGAMAPIGAALQSGAVKSAHDAFHDPALAGARDALLAELQRRAAREELLLASAELQRQHGELANAPVLSPADLQRLGVLSGLALALSTRAIEQDLSAQDLFTHAVARLSPWLDRAVDCGIVKLPQECRALGGEAGALTKQIIRAAL